MVERIQDPNETPSPWPLRGMTIARQGSRVSRRGPAYVSIWLPRRWRHHRFVAAVLIDHGRNGNGIRRYRRRPASDGRSYRNVQRIVRIRRVRFVRAAEHDPAGRSDLAVPDRRDLQRVPEPVVPEPAGRPNRRDGPHPATVSALAAGGIPATALDAYRRAAAAANPACGITWPLLAAIGRVESNHGRFAGAVLHSDGLSTPPIIGIRLDGSRSVVVRDTDGGRLDGDRTYDHAVGPMQFIPSTWEAYRSDGNGDGRYDPFNIYDAAAATARYLCQAGGDMRTAAGQQRAVWSYNPSTSYVSEVLALEAAYAAGAGIVVPVPPAVIQPLPPPVLPPVNPAPPLAASPSAHATAPHASASPTAKPKATAHPTPKPTTASSIAGSDVISVPRPHRPRRRSSAPSSAAPSSSIVLVGPVRLRPRPRRRSHRAPGRRPAHRHPARAPRRPLLRRRRDRLIRRPRRRHRTRPRRPRHRARPEPSQPCRRRPAPASR